MNTDYFFKSTGDAMHTGETEDEAWPLSKMNENLYGAGDRLLIWKNDTLTGTVNFLSGGAPGNPIKFDLFGFGIDNAVIDGGASSNPVLKFNNKAHIEINNLVLRNSASGNGIINLTGGASDIKVNNCYIHKGIRGINAVSCGDDLVFQNSYFTDIADDVDHTHGGGSHIQLNQCSGARVKITGNKCYTPVTPGTSGATDGVGDIISIFKCTGRSDSYILVENNDIRGGSSHLDGYCAIVLGDVGGIYQVARNNRCTNNGRAGAQIQGGTFIVFEDNFIYSALFPYTRVGFSFGNYSELACNNITVQRNKITFYSEEHHGAFFSKYIDHTYEASTSTGLVGGPALATPAGWETNTPDTELDGDAFDAINTNPLWVGSPWNTPTGSHKLVRGSRIIKL
jgi:hypothetical protein